MDYAVSVAHVDVLSLSLGQPSSPDVLTDNAFRLAAEAAVRAGVTVVAASGDGGPDSGFLAPASDPLVINAGATTSLQLYPRDPHVALSWGESGLPAPLPLTSEVWRHPDIRVKMLKFCLLCPAGSIGSSQI